MFQELMQHLSAVQMRTMDDLLEDTWHEDDRVWTRYNPVDTLSYSARNSENTGNWWQLLGAVSYFHYSPGPAITWAPKAQGRVSWVSLTPNMWCLSKQHSIHQTPTGCATTQFNSDRKLGELTYILHVDVSELSSVQMRAMCAHPSWFDKVSKTGKFRYPNSEFNNSVNLMTKLRKTTHIRITPYY